MLVPRETRVRDQLLPIALCGAVLILPAVLLGHFMPPVLAPHAAVRQNRILLRPASGAYEDVLVLMHTAPTDTEPTGVDLVLTGPGSKYKLYLEVALPALSCSLRRDGAGSTTASGTFGTGIVRSWMGLGGLDGETTARAGEASELDELVRGVAGGADLFKTASGFHYFEAERMTGAVYILPTVSAYLQTGLWFAVWLATALFFVLRALKESKRGTAHATPTGT